MPAVSLLHDLNFPILAILPNLLHIRLKVVRLLLSSDCRHPCVPMIFKATVTLILIMESICSGAFCQIIDGRDISGC